MSNNPRLYLWLAVLLMLGLNYEAWMRDYGPHPAEQRIAQSPSAPPDPGSTPAQTSASAVPIESAPDQKHARVHVQTDVLSIDISTQGGTIERAALLKYPLVKGRADPVLLENDSPATRYLLQSGLTGSEQGGLPDHLAMFSAAQSTYELGSANELRVPLTWSNDQGLSFTKTFVFKRGQYRIGLEQDLSNAGPHPVQVAPYTQILRNDPRTESSMFNAESRTYHGPVYYDGSKYTKLSMSPEGDDAHLSREVTGGWIAAVQHHFVTAVVPPVTQPMQVTLGIQSSEYRLAATGHTRVVPPGGTARFPQTLFIGPQLQSELDSVGPSLGLVSDFGWLSPLAKPLFWLLKQAHQLTGNWGIAIVAVTFLLKLVFYPLQESSGRSMAKMKNLGPRMKALQETYKDDKERLGQAMMELYKQEKVNPVAGCLPILIQIPVFFAFYWMLQASVEMRQAPFLLWIKDLSSHDPFFVLPALLAGAMYLQFQLNPPSPDPVQAKVMKVMPLMMAGMLAFLPAGLVLYSVTNSLLSIAQQWNINRRLALPAQQAA